MSTLSNGQRCAYSGLEGTEEWRDHDHEATCATWPADDVDEPQGDDVDPGQQDEGQQDEGQQDEGQP